MALVVNTSKAEALLASIRKAIDEGKVDTWAYDSAGDFTHKPTQWNKKAWLRPFISDGALQFRLLGQKDVPTTEVVYGVYHGRFIEMLVTHFATDFSSVTAKPQGL